MILVFIIIVIIIVIIIIIIVIVQAFCQIFHILGIQQDLFHQVFHVSKGTVQGYIVVVNEVFHHNLLADKKAPTGANGSDPPVPWAGGFSDLTGPAGNERKVCYIPSQRSAPLYFPSCRGGSCLSASGWASASIS